MFNQLDPGFSPDEILVYLRKSRFDDPLLSVEEILSRHEAILDEWSEKHLGGKIPEKNKYREIVSGETIEDRPEVKKLLKRIESPKIKAVLIVEVQRLSRGDLEDAGRLIKLLRYTNTLVITPQFTYDLTNEYSRDTFERELKRGNDYLEYQKKILGRGRMLSVQQGNYIGSIPPYGYEKAVISEGKTKRHTLKIKEDEAVVVRKIFDMYVNEDMGRTSICHRLNGLGVPPPKGEYWSPAALKDMLGNVHYIGKVKWNWRKTVTVVENSEFVRTRPKAKPDDYLVFEGLHPAIVSDGLFKAAQDKQGRNYRAKSGVRIRNPLAGLLFCQCGRAMSLRTYKTNGNERSAPRMLCDNQAICKTASCLYDELIERVCHILESSISDFEVKLKSKDSGAKKRKALIDRLENRLDDLNRKEIRQWEKYSEESMPRHVFEELNARVVREKDAVTQELRRAREELPAPVDYAAHILRFSEALAALKDPDVTAAVKNRLLKECIQRIVYHRDPSVRIVPGSPPSSEPTSKGWVYSPFELDVYLRL